MDPIASSKLAIDIVHFPSGVRSLRLVPLPDDVQILLRIVAGDEEATSEAASLTGRSRNTIREAAAFFVDQVLLFPGADSYRVLGVRSDATYGELRRNMALLLRWLHPDHDGQGERVIFATRVTRAWSDLKTPERRAAFDRQSLAMAENSLLRQNRVTRAQSNRRWSAPSGIPVVYRRSIPVYPFANRGFLRRVWLLLFGRAVI